MLLKILLIAGLTRLLVKTNQPLLCSSLYTAAIAGYALITGASLIPVLIAAAIIFTVSTAYFWVLNKFGEDVVPFVVITIIGAGILAFVL